MAGIGGLLDSLRADVSLGTRPAAGQEGDEETYITAVWDALCRHRLLETILNQLLDRSVPGACPDHERALRHKDAGNSFFKAGLYEDATKEYDECLHWLDARAWPVQAAQAYSNRALCWLRRGQATAAEEDAGQALTLDPANAKAAFRRSSARMALEDWPGALVDALAAQASAPGPDVEAAVARCRTAVGGVENMARGGAPACAERASGPDTDGSLRQAAASPAPSQPAVGGRQAQDPRLGRELVATRQVSRGECVLREAPAAWVLGRAASQEVRHSGGKRVIELASPSSAGCLEGLKAWSRHSLVSTKRQDVTLPNPSPHPPGGMHDRSSLLFFPSVCSAAHAAARCSGTPPGAPSTPASRAPWPCSAAPPAALATLSTRRAGGSAAARGPACCPPTPSWRSGWC